MRGCLAAAIILLAGPALAQEFGDYGVGHEEFHSFYNHGERRPDGSMGPLMRPHQPHVKCCDGDCRPTKARQAGNGWEVWLDRRWVPVPSNRIKTDVQPPNNTAHACATRAYGSAPIEVFCFVPPKTEI